MATPQDSAIIAIVARAAAVFAILAALGAPLASCAGQVPSGSSCSSSSQCESGLTCLYALGAGCSAQGHCVIATTDCSGTTLGLSLCACGGATLDLTCIPTSAALSQQTATGAACGLDGGADVADAADATH
jgi:hypothetical protein